MDLVDVVYFSLVFLDVDSVFVYGGFADGVVASVFEFFQTSVD